MKWPYRVIQVINAELVGNPLYLSPSEYPEYRCPAVQPPEVTLKPAFTMDYVRGKGWKQGDPVPPLSWTVPLLCKEDAEAYRLGTIHWFGDDDGKENGDRGVAAAAPVNTGTGGTR